jgi:CelD/BcsL family acetyltransferase involved in cellulose biosynthesis
VPASRPTAPFAASLDDPQRAADLARMKRLATGLFAVAAAVFLACGRSLTYKYGASDARFLNMRPNNLLYMEAIRWGCENGMRVLDLGRTDWGHDSLRAFKLGWGADERELHYHRLGSGRADHGGRATRALGAVIQRGPPVVSRLTGEILYRHAG